MSDSVPTSIACLVSLVALAATCQDARADAVADRAEAAQRIAFFEERVRPVLVEHCYACHGVESDRLEGGLLLDSLEGHLTGGDSGPAIVPGDVDGSLLIEAVRYDSYEMPPEGKLSDRDIAALERWVAMGAPWPAEPVREPSDQPMREVFDLEARKADHWAWAPVEDPEPPTVRNTAWPRTDADRFILSRLEAADLRPAPEVDRRGLLRRACFDLTGLPPSPDQIERFLGDEHPDAFARVVDELLDSPRFGERWGRHWLDLVRYAESRGHEFDGDAANAHQYRDYVIRALNADVPYDQFVREHLAGDLIESPRLNPDKGFNESILGTGFWYLGEWVHSPVDVRRDEADRFDNMIDVMSKAFLGVTVACARCHDHKFDAISTEDYYSLSGFLQSSDYRQVRFESLEHNRSVAERLDEVDRGYRQRLDSLLESAGLPNEPAAPESAPLPGVVVDYGDLDPIVYLQDGYTFGPRPRLVGDPYVAESDGEPRIRFASRNAAVSDPAWRDLESITEGPSKTFSKLEELPRSGRTLRTPTFDLEDEIVHCRVRGRGHLVVCVDSHRMINGPLHGQTLQKIESAEPWKRIDLTAYVGHRVHLEFVPAVDGALEVSLVLQGASEETLRAVEAREAAAEQRIARQKRSLDELLAADTSIRDAYLTLASDWARERQAVEKEVQRTSRLAIAMLDGTGEDDHVLIRGNSGKPGELVPRRFLSAIAGDRPMEIEAGSGRLGLARQITDPTNPLTSRVIVNRVWHHLMGRGLVPTTDDFGVLGQRPTHPELLDYLATRFIADGQSLKRMIRYVMLSGTYRLSTYAEAGARFSDPNNLLWSYRPPKRLEGEAIRDALLAVSGRLDTTVGGPPVGTHLTPFMTGRGRPQSGPLDGDGRRSVYLAVRRNFLSPFMVTFDTPSPFSTMGKRNVSNVPAQSLILMNDPLVAELATSWAERVLAIHTDESDEVVVTRRRIRSMYVGAYGREPTPSEADLAIGFVQGESADRGVPLDDTGVWADLAHALANTKEFIFLR